MAWLPWLAAFQAMLPPGLTLPQVGGCRATSEATFRRDIASASPRVPINDGVRPTVGNVAPDRNGRGCRSLAIVNMTIGKRKRKPLAPPARSVQPAPRRGRPDLVATVAELQAAGVTSLRAIAAELNARGIPTATGVREWRGGAGLAHTSAVVIASAGNAR
jgi:hypothetical protein